VRDVHFSHYGRMCPIETPEGPNIGLIGSLAPSPGSTSSASSRPRTAVDNGKVTDEVVYMTADEEDEYVVAQANSPRRERQLRREGRPRVLVRRRRPPAKTSGCWFDVPPRPVVGAYMDVSPRQMVSVATALIPFLEHDDANRALMGANMQRQAVPLMRAEAAVHRHRNRRPRRSRLRRRHPGRGDGVVTEVSADITVMTTTTAASGLQALAKFRAPTRTPASTSAVIVTTANAWKPAPCWPTARHRQRRAGAGQEPARRLHAVGGLQLRGRHHPLRAPGQDDVLTSIHIEEYEVDARDTKLGPRRSPATSRTSQRRHPADLDERGIIRIGAEVEAGDILVGKVTPKGETELTPEERLLRAIFGEKAREVRDTSLKVPHGETGKVIDVKVFPATRATSCRPA
jgi:DNA-directed RNA polymerase subunit beta